MALYKSVLVILLLSQSILPGMMIPISIFWGSYVSRAFPRAPSLVNMERSRPLFFCSLSDKTSGYINIPISLKLRDISSPVSRGFVVVGRRILRILHLNYLTSDTT